MRRLFKIIRDVRFELHVTMRSGLTADWMHEFVARRAAERAKAYLETLKKNKTIIDYTVIKNEVLFISFLSVFEDEVYRIAMPLSAV
jgi:hypothetical protein